MFKQIQGLFTFFRSIVLFVCVNQSAVCLHNYTLLQLFERKRFGTVCMPYFRIARDPTAAALADPYLGQSIGPVPGYGVSLPLQLSIFFLILIF